ncbi:hypothetical protein PVK06_004808 [Gossypium arboreum]|uniref:Uncharacterized protein n=1 Tax=Gossypium arboreum TaxID=29729 RepID=A0ABR0QTX6_GOSAR|nr:hypothetical protein PVK06_004808 [Gossypium arboreum]
MTDSLSTVDFAVGSNPSSSSSGEGQVTKKVRTKLNFSPDMDDPTMNRNGQKNVSMEEELELLEGDVVTEVVDDVLLIMSPNKV